MAQKPDPEWRKCSWRPFQNLLLGRLCRVDWSEIEASTGLEVHVSHNSISASDKLSRRS